MDIVGDRSLDNLRSQFESMPADSRAREFALRLVKGVVLTLNIWMNYWGR